MLAALPTPGSLKRAPKQTFSKIHAVNRYLIVLNDHDAEGLRDVFDQNADICFANDVMGLETLVRETRKCFDAFPDTMFYGAEPAENEDGDVVIDGLRVRGTHTGPYAFGPFPSIPPTGRLCINDPEKIIAKVDKNGKIVKVTFIAKGKLTGFPGFYKQIGGRPIL